MVTPAVPIAPRDGVSVSMDSTVIRRASVWPALIALTKPRLAVFSVLTTVVACVTSGRAPTWSGLLLVVTGTALAAGGALSLNQWLERHLDAVMARTRGRPLPANALTPRAALAWSLALSFGGTVFLAVFVNLTSAALAAATILLYGGIYTPLKRRTRWATELGSISGALPALIGSAAAGELASPAALTLTTVLLFWQMPHFYAIGWKHRRDYRAAGFKLLPAIDATGVRTGAWSVFYATLLLIVSLAPCALHQHGLVYGAIALLAGAGLWQGAWRFARANTGRDRAASRLFVASIAYLPIVMLALVLDHGLAR